MRKIGLLSMVAYGDSFFGVGPRLDFKIGEHFEIWAAFSVAFRPAVGA